MKSRHKFPRSPGAMPTRQMRQAKSSENAATPSTEQRSSAWFVWRISADPSRYWRQRFRSEEHTSELQSLTNLVCRLLLEKKKKKKTTDDKTQQQRIIP